MDEWMNEWMNGWYILFFRDIVLNNWKYSTSVAILCHHIHTCQVDV